MKKYTPYIIIFAVVAVIVLILLFAFNTKAKPKTNTTNNSGAEGGGSNNVPMCSATFPNESLQVYTGPMARPLDYDAVLQCGSYSVEVAKLQELLNIDVDGKFGNLTQTAVVKAFGKKSISLSEAMPFAANTAPANANNNYEPQATSQLEAIWYGIKNLF